MTAKRVREFADQAAGEIAAAIAAVDGESVDSLVETLMNAHRVFVSGVGRSGLVGRAIAMRLMHIGLSAYAVGEVSTPGIDSGDLLLAITATGRGTIENQCQVAVKAGAAVAVISTRSTGAIHDLAEVAVLLPIRSAVPTQQHAGSLFEQSALVIGDAVCREIQGRRGVPTAELDRRHANLS